MEGHTISLIASAITGVLMLLLGVISWFLRDKVKENDTRMTRHEDRIQKLELENRDQQAELKQIAESLKSIGELRAELAIRYVSRDELSKLDGKLDRIMGEITALKIQAASEQRPPRGRGAREGS